jgi:hypothetical protein
MARYLDDILKNKYEISFKLEFSMYLTYLCMRNKNMETTFDLRNGKTLNKKVISFDGTLYQNLS